MTWQYKTVHARSEIPKAAMPLDKLKWPERDDIDRFIDMMGRDGWELAAIFDGTFYFKRPEQ